LTVNSFNSVSLDPPLVLWSLAHKAQSLDAFRKCERYLVHVLAVNQLDLAGVFANPRADKFATTRWHPMPRACRCSKAASPGSSAATGASTTKATT